jgi:hypothetical protein
MNRYFVFLFVLSFSLKAYAQEMEWPRSNEYLGNKLTLYQPQVENWLDNKTLDFRMAFTLVPYSEKQLVGVVYVQANTVVDMNTHMVDITQFSIVKTDFPGLDSAKAVSSGKIVALFLKPDTTISMPLEQLVASTKKSDKPSTVQVNNTPPSIFISTGPAILLQLSGEAQLASSLGSKSSTLEYIVNANWPVFYDKSTKEHFLYDDQEWQTSASLDGPWTFTAELPQQLNDLVEDSAWAVLKPAIPAPFEASPTMPKIYYSDSPAEIILFDGQPKYQTISGTALAYATNTESDIFFYISNSEYYYLSSGRWFSSKSLEGPWIFASNDLPADFSKIPLSSPAAAVLSSVPGTDQAADAVMIAQIPTVQTVNVQDAEKNVQVSYSGPAEFEPIEGTSMQYAVNTSNKVIEVNSDSYYLCYNGVWFSSATSGGPWVVATMVPQVIYTIPSNSPMYNVTYVTQTTTSSGAVQSSSTAGYMGAFVVGVTVGAIVTSGTGYYYPPYYYHPPYGYPVCYHYPSTYGAYAYHSYPYYGTSYGASYNPYTGTSARSATAYGPYGSQTVAQAYNPYTGTGARGTSVSTPYGTASAAQAYNPYTGASARGATATNAYGSAAAAGGYNPSTGNTAATRQESGVNGNAGKTSVSNGNGDFATTAHASNSQGSVAAASTSDGGKAVVGSGQDGSGSAMKTSDGNMYASQNGNVYKNTDGSWQSANNNGSSDRASSSQMQSINNESQNRESGSMQSNQFSQGRSFGGFGGSGSYGGGGFSGGGMNGGGFRGGGGRR